MRSEGRCSGGRTVKRPDGRLSADRWPVGVVEALRGLDPRLQYPTMMTFPEPGNEHFNATENRRAPKLKVTGTGVGQVVLWLIALIAFIGGVTFAIFGQSEIHEILAGMCFVIFTLAIVGITITRAITRLR